ncbi:MAG: DUF1631 family protein, partial [Planctomycetota bacterium]
MHRSTRSLADDVLTECRELLSKRLFDAWPAMMDQADDALFNLAEQATDNRSQEQHFEAMRHVRLQRTAMEAKFKSSVSDGVVEQKPSPESQNVTPFDGLSTMELSLIDNDDLEESLAVTNMVEKIKSNCQRDLFALNRRVAVLLGDADLPNPFGPQVICNAFREACDELELPIELRLLVLKLFDRHVVSEVTAIYAQLNEVLVDRGILPEIRAEIKRTPTQSRSGEANLTTSDLADEATTAHHGAEGQGSNPIGTAEASASVPPAYTQSNYAVTPIT